MRYQLFLGTLAVLGFSLAPSGPAVAAAEADITGHYRCTGVEGGVAYGGSVTITKNGDTYELHWTIGRTSHVGVAIRQGNQLSSSWAYIVNNRVIKGVVIYQIEKGNKLVGIWSAYPGNGKIHKETLIYKKALD